jgi:hypothetical protein
MTERQMESDRYEAEKQAAIARTQTLAKTVVALTEGQPPSKDEVISGIDQMQVALDDAKRKLPSEGREVLEHTQEVLDSTKQLMREREGLAQKTYDFAYETYKAVEESTQSLKNLSLEERSKLGGDRDMRERARSAAERVLHVLRLLATSGEGRAMTSEIAALLRSFLIQIGRATEEVVKAKTDELSGEAPSATPVETKKAPLKEEEHITPTTTPATGTGKRTKKQRRKQRKAQHGVGETLEKMAESGEEEGDDEGSEESETTKVGESPEEIKMREVKEKLMKEADVRKDRAINHARSILQAAARNPDLKQALNDLMAIAKDYANKLELLARKSTDKVKSKVDTSVDRVARAAEALAKEIAPEELLTDIKENSKALVEEVRNDEKLNEYFREVKKFMDATLDSPDWIASDEWTQKVRDLVTRGQDVFDLMNEKVRGRVNDIANSIDRLVITLKNDPYLAQFQRSVKKLSDDLFVRDNQGRMRLNQRAIEEIKKVVTPMLSEKMKYIALPNVEYSDETYDFVASEVVITASEIPPSAITSHFETAVDFDLTKMEAIQTMGRLSIYLNDVRLVAKGFRFAFKRKSWPRLEDAGHADLETKGKGVNLCIDFQYQDTQPYLSRPSVRCNIDHLHIKALDDSDHQVLINFLTSIYRGRIEYSIERQIEETLEKAGESVAEMINHQLEMWKETSQGTSTSTSTSSYTTTTEKGKGKGERGVQGAEVEEVDEDEVDRPHTVYKTKTEEGTKVGLKVGGLAKGHGDEGIGEGGRKVVKQGDAGITLKIQPQPSK